MQSKEKPMFNSDAEALNYYSKKLQQLCFKYGKSPKEMMIFAEDSGIFNEDLLEFLSLDRKIGFFKDHEQKKTRPEHLGKLSKRP